MGKSSSKSEERGEPLPTISLSANHPNCVNGVLRPAPAGLCLLRGIHYSL
jgi:hypothetical protein